MTDVNEKKVVGRIIKLSKKGWGFISSKEIEFTRIFFHWTALRQDTVGFLELKTGMYVEFTPQKVAGKGVRANHMRVVDKPKEIENAEPTAAEVPQLSE